MSKFAFGENTVFECPCPAKAAGYEPIENDLDVDVAQFAGRYDTEVENLGYGDTYSYKGRIPENEAKEAWLEMIEYAEDSVAFSNEQVEVAEEIAMTLGWLDDD